jgi:hypothetical protein
MAGFATVRDAYAKADNSRLLAIHGIMKGYTWTTPGATPVTLWPFAGFPGAGSNATVGLANGRVCTAATAGAMQWWNVAAGETAWLVGANYMTSASSLTMVLFDRVADFNMVVEASGAVTGCDATSRLEASGNGLDSGCMIYTEVTSTLPALTRTKTFTYTNQDGASKTTQQVVTVSSGAAQHQAFSNNGFFVPLAQGDYGVRSIESVADIAGTGTGGALNVCLVRPLMWFAGTVQAGMEKDLITMLPFPRKLFDDSCLMMAGVNAATSGAQNWSIHPRILVAS